MFGSAAKQTPHIIQEYFGDTTNRYPYCTQGPLPQLVVPQLFLAYRYGLNADLLRYNLFRVTLMSVFKYVFNGILAKNLCNFEVAISSDGT